MLPPPSQRGRPPTDRRPIISAILYILKGGIPWRLLPADFPPWQTVEHVFRQWTLGPHLGASQRASARPRPGHARQTLPPDGRYPGQPKCPVRCPRRRGGPQCRQGHPRPPWSTRSVWCWGGLVTPASTPERAGAQALLARVLGWLTWLRLLWVDGGYTGPAFAQWVKTIRPKLAVTVVKRSDDVTGFVVRPRRWVVERTFGWLMRQRRLVRDYETTATSAEAWIYIAMIRIQLRRLA